MPLARDIQDKQSFPYRYRYQPNTPTCFESLSSPLHGAIMSHTQPTPSSSSNFQPIFNDALKAYQKRAKHNLLEHPLAAQLQTCNSTTTILALLYQQVQELNQSRNNDERLTKWLDPIVNVLYTFSATLGEGVGLVCTVTARLRFSSLYSFSCQVFSPAKVIFAGTGVLLLVRISVILCVGH